MIRATVVCPHPPLLFRELGGHVDAAQQLRAACREALADALRPAPGLVVVLGGDAVTASWDPATSPRPEGFGRHGRPGAGLPLSLGVGRRLLDDAGWTGPVRLHSIAWDAGTGPVTALGAELAAVDGDVVLLVLADGSARRGDKAPGYVDARAFEYDEQTVHALATGDPAGLLGQDAVLADQLMAGGRAALQVMAAAVRAQGSAPRAGIRYQHDPFGVMYVVAVWAMDPVSAG